MDMQLELSKKADTYEINSLRVDLRHSNHRISELEQDIKSLTSDIERIKSALQQLPILI